ncbi:unnamed protein product [Rotaria socialis]|nr:unnamed protein product [Rotaria socialis]
MTEMNIETSYPIKPELPSGDDLPTIVANDSLSLADSQQGRRRQNRVHNQRRNTGRIVWNDETKQVEIQDDSSVGKKSNDTSSDKDIQQSSMIGSRSLMSRFNNSNKECMPPVLRINRSHNHEPSKKALTAQNSSLVHGISSKKDNNDLSMIKLYEETKKLIDQLNEQADRLEKDIIDRDQIIENLKTSQYFEQSFDKREKRVYERRISELGDELQKIDSIKSDNIRFKEENAALIRLISKLSK